MLDTPLNTEERSVQGLGESSILGHLHAILDSPKRDVGFSSTIGSGETSELNRYCYQLATEVGAK